MTTIPPAWTHLEPASLRALLEPPGGIPQAMRLTPGSVPVEAALQVPVVKAARLLLERALSQDGFVLTARGALKRVDVRHVFDQTEWPAFDKAAILAVSKVINEDDAHGVLFTRIALQASGLLRKRLGRLRVTKAGKALLAPEAAPALLALLFEAVFWKMNLQDFDWNPVDFWPQHHMGVVLWCLSVAGHEWSDAIDLMNACTIMETLENPSQLDMPQYAVVARVLRPLAWLGLLESRSQKGLRTWDDDESFRVTPLFSQLISFDVAMQGMAASRH